MRISPALLGIVVVTGFAFSAWQATAAQESKTRNSCLGLHAGITAQLTQGYEDPSVTVAFLLLNDSDTAQNTAPESWQIEIDGKELSDSGWIFGNGPGPVGGYGKLESGTTFQFGKALSINKYFPGAGEHRIRWRGRHFQSPTATIEIPKPK